MSRSPRTGAFLLWSFDEEVPAGGAVSVVELQQPVLLALGWSWKRAASGPVLAQGAVVRRGMVSASATQKPCSSRTENHDYNPPAAQRLAAALVSCRPHPLTCRLRHSARSSVGAMGLFSHEEFRDPDEGLAGGASGGALERARAADVDVFGSDDPVVVGPGLPPEDGSCGQFAVQFHVSTSMLVGLKRIADMRGVSVPEVCRQVIGVFVAQQEGELGALLAAEAEVANYRPSLGDA